MKRHRAQIRPDVFPVYSEVSFDVTISIGEPIYGGSIIEVQLPNSFTNDKVSPSKVKSWQCADPDARHYIGVKAGQLDNMDFTVGVLPREYVGGYSAPARHGKCVVIELKRGLLQTGEEVVLSYRNTTSPWLANQLPGSTDHEGTVLVMIDGGRIDSLPTYSVAAGTAVVNRVIIPSSGKPSEPFTVSLISIDQFNNLSSTNYRDVSITYEGAVLADGISYTGRTNVEVVISEIGIHRLMCNGVVSNPIDICKEPNGPYWGDIHIHNYPSVDAMGNTPYEYARDVSCLDFAATAEHGAGGLREHWAQTRKWAREHNEPGHFVTILALETNTKWHHNIYFYDDDVPMVATQKNGDSLVSAEDLLDYVADKKVLTQIHHTGWGFDMRLRYPDTTRLFEIYSMHGSSEYRDPLDPLFMDKNRNRAGDAKIGPYYARDAWALGQRFVTHGSSDNHFGQGGVRHNSVTAVLSDMLERGAILDAMKNGACYATTGERILLDFRINGRPMGSEIQISSDNRLRIELTVHGTDVLGSVEIFACQFIEGERGVAVNSMMFAEDDTRVAKAIDSWNAVLREDEIGKLDAKYSLELHFDRNPLVFYAKITQRDLITLPGILEGEKVPQQRSVVAWSSPIWVREA